MIDPTVELNLEILYKEIDALKKRIGILEELVKNKKPETNPPNIWPNDFPNTPQLSSIPTCSKCGLDISKPIGYCCPNMDCPVGLGPIVCGG